MDIKEWINNMNNIIPSIDEFMFGFKKITSTEISREETIIDIQRLKIDYFKNKETNNIIEELIYNTNVNQTDCFYNLRISNKLVINSLNISNNLLEFGSFLECDVLYLNTENNEIWIQEPGTNYYDEPDSVVKGFSSGESFLKSIYLIQKAFYEKWYKQKTISEDLLNAIYRLNDDECIEVIDKFYYDLINFE
ncbi:MAG: hypothetical protein V4585_07725 [Bacteroidota bacterium]